MSLKREEVKLSLINRLAKAFAMRESKEHAIASSTPQLVHMSTYPLKLAKKAFEKKAKEASEADSGSTNSAVLR